MLKSRRKRQERQQGWYKQLNQIKDAGEAYSVSGERAAELEAAGVAEIVG